MWRRIGEGKDTTLAIEGGARRWDGTANEQRIGEGMKKEMTVARAGRGALEEARKRRSLCRGEKMVPPKNFGVFPLGTGGEGFTPAR